MAQRTATDLLATLALWALTHGSARSVEPPAHGGVPAAAPPFAAERTVAGRPYVLLGHGVRKKPAADLYSIALYVDEVGARRAFPALAARAGGRTRDKLLSGDKAPAFVVWGTFGKMAVLRFERDADAAEVRGAFEEGLESLLSERAPPELRERVRAFVALFERELKRGDVVEVRTGPGGRVDVVIAGVQKEAGTDARLARALWEIWLGGKPVANELRRALVDQVEVLGRRGP